MVFRYPESRVGRGLATVDLTNEFRVSVPVEEAFAILTDVERIAPCMPGATLEEIDGEEYSGSVKVKVGPITANYRGKATFLERDQSGHRAVLRAEGRETRGQGNASATITATITADGGGSAVKVVTDLAVTGKVAQFGRGVLADVSAKLMQQFVDALEADLARFVPADAPATPTPVPSVPVDLVGAAGVPVAKRVLPVVAVVFVAYWLLRRKPSRGRRST
jgi:uncharacterized protein